MPSGSGRQKAHSGMSRIRLGVNVDHVATLREVRKGIYPDPVEAARICAKGGADRIVCHLREDRRHIHERDVGRLLETIHLPLNLEMSSSSEIVQIALQLRPYQVTLVPERRQELTTEGGLDVLANERKLKNIVSSFRGKKIRVSLFIDPELKQLDGAFRLKADAVEFHTGTYANASPLRRKYQLRKLSRVCREAHAMGLEVAAGHGLHYRNVRPVTRIGEIEELNIGHSIVSRALFVGLAEAVREMKGLLSENSRKRR